MGIVRWRLRVADRLTAQPPSAVSEAATIEPDTAAPVAGQVPVSVLSIALPGSVVLVDGASSRRDLKLARDVAAAASRDWRATPVSRRFDWSPRVAGDGVPPAADAGTRAFNAFVDKDLVDHGAWLLLCIEPLARLLPESFAGCRRLVIPALDVLGREADAKRALWQAIEDSRR
jgi:hypothetical protein